MIKSSACCFRQIHRRTVNKPFRPLPQFLFAYLAMKASILTVFRTGSFQWIHRPGSQDRREISEDWIERRYISYSALLKYLYSVLSCSMI